MATNTPNPPGGGGLHSVQNVQTLEHAVVANAEQAVDSLINVVNAGAQFIPQEIGGVAADLLALLRQAKSTITGAQAGQTPGGPSGPSSYRP